MAPQDLSQGRRAAFVLLTACVLAFGLSACGRRGPLEAPPDASATAPAAARPATTRRVVARPTQPAKLGTQPQSVTEDTPDDESDDEDPAQSITPTPNPTPTPRKRGRLYTIPKEPFILDPLL